MRIAFIGISHWHAPHYFRAVSRLPGTTIVGIAERDARALQRVGAELDVPAYEDYRALIETERPDFVFAFGVHSEIAEVGGWLIEHGIPCLLEKPAGLNHAQVAALRDRANAKQLHVGTGFNFLVSDFHTQVMNLIEDDQVSWASFRFIGGGPNRYRESGNTWMLDPQRSGGGSTINLSVHFFDMFRRYTRSEPTEVVSLMGNHTWDLPVEDYSSVIIRSASAVCTVETGYTFPGRNGWDLRFAVRTKRHHLIMRSDNVIEIYRSVDGEMKSMPTASAGNSYWYPLFVQETLARFARGEKPIAGLDDLAEAMRMVDAAYASNRAGGAAQRLN